MRNRALTVPEVEPSAVIIERIKKTISSLREHLDGTDKEAVRARELLGGLISKVVLTPKEGTKTDGRGAGDVTIHVEGPIGALIDLSGLDISRVTKTAPLPVYGLDNAKADWTLEIDLLWVDPRVSIVLADLPYLEVLLDRADVPVTVKALANALEVAAQKNPGLGAGNTAANRARNLFSYTLQEGITRYIRVGKGHMGHVWAGSPISDEEWCQKVLSKQLSS